MNEKRLAELELKKIRVEYWEKFGILISDSYLNNKGEQNEIHR